MPKLLKIPMLALLLLSLSYSAYGQNTALQLQKLVASDRDRSDNFGHSVCIDGNYAIVGAYLESSGCHRLLHSWVCRLGLHF